MKMFHISASSFRPTFLILLLTALLAPAVLKASTDTTYTVSFRLNMSKAIESGTFKPDSDYVYMVMDQMVPTISLVRNPGGIYTAALPQGLNPAITYNFRFRINNSIYDTTRRSITPIGATEYRAWWLNDPIAVTTLRVNMQEQANLGHFNPATDAVYITGTVNTAGTAILMAREDTTLVYRYTDTILDPGSIQYYKYRINTSAAGLELQDKPSRIIRIADTVCTVLNDFDNYNPARLPFTLNCNMQYYARSHQFDPAADFIDVAGNFNGNGANDVLFDPNSDTVYSVTLYLDTAWISQGPLAFRFRINGNPTLAELQGKPDRTYALHDTTGNNPNLFSCWYNDMNPQILRAPWATNLSIQGSLVIKKFLTGTYVYQNVNGIPEGASLYRWLRSTNAQGSDAVPIDSATKISYVVDTLDIGKWLVFEVTPVAITGDSATGKPVRIVTSNSISAWDVGFGEHGILIGRVYPNPAREAVRIETTREVSRIELVNLAGVAVLVKPCGNERDFIIETGNFPSGLYLLRAVTASGQGHAVRLIIR